MPASSWLVLTENRWYAATKLDALVLFEAGLTQRLPVRHGRGTPVVDSGSFLIFTPSSPYNYQVDDGRTWNDVDFDGVFNISRCDSDGLMRKELSVYVGAAAYHVVSYYDPWEAVAGDLTLPGAYRALDGINLHGICAHGPSNTLTSMEVFHENLKLAGIYRLFFVRNVAFLLLSWTSEPNYLNICENDRQIRLPFIPSNQRYWHELSGTTYFADKRPDELEYQMSALLDKLISISAPTVVCGRQPSPDFTPLQNVCLYSLAFGAKKKPLGAFWPLNTEKLRGIVGQFGGVHDVTAIRPRHIEVWDCRLRQLLPINCARSEPVLISDFPQTLALICTEEYTEILTTFEFMCEQFPSFRRPELRQFALLHHLYYCTKNDSISEKLRSWSISEDGRDARLRLWKIYQTPLEPIELALVLSDSLALSRMNKQHKDSSPNKGDSDDSQSQSFRGYQGFLDCLSNPEAKDDHSLLYIMIDSFYRALDSLPEPGPSAAIENFLEVAAEQTYTDILDRDLYAYFRTRVAGKDHTYAMAVAANRFPPIP